MAAMGRMFVNPTFTDNKPGAQGGDPRVCTADRCQSQDEILELKVEDATETHPRLSRPGKV